MYQSHFGLKETAFSLTPDPRYLFLSDAHKEALASMIYGVRERKGFVLILGEVGTGKTTIIRHILGEFGAEIRTVYIFQPRLGFEELLEAALRELELPCPRRDRAEMIATLNAYLIQELAAGRYVVFIIDEAQHLSIDVLEELRLLSNLETASNKLLQIILVGQPELGAKLGRPALRQLRQRIGLVARLAPLTLDETRRYIAHRLVVAGGHGTSPFRPRAIRLIHRASGGIPRLINVVCDTSLLLAYGGGMQRVGTRLVRQVLRDRAVFEVDRHAAERAGGGRRHPFAVAGGLAAAAVLAGVLFVHAPAADRLREAVPWVVQTPQPRATASPVSAATLPGARDASRTEDREVAPAAAPVPAPERALPPRQTVPASAPADTPVVKTDTPVVKTEAPVVKADMPVVKAETPAVKAETPAVKAETPAVKAETPVVKAETPVARAETPLVKADTPIVKEIVARRGDTLAALIVNVYGHVDHTLLDVVQRANPGIVDVDVIEVGRHVRFPTLDASNAVERRADGVYVVHLLTVSADDSRKLREVRARVSALQRTPYVVPVRISRELHAVRILAGDFHDRREAEAFRDRFSAVSRSASSTLRVIR